MDSQAAISLERWIRTLPSSQLVFPRSFSDRLKYIFWRLYTPFHPLVRDGALMFGIIEHAGRQNFFLGHIAPSETIRTFVSSLTKYGYGNHFIAWKDEGEVISLRHIVDFDHQYHIRIFEDGEVRAHYEYTPESHPIWHMTEVGCERRREYFLQLFGNRLVTDRPSVSGEHT